MILYIVILVLIIIFSENYTFIYSRDGNTASTTNTIGQSYSNQHYRCVLSFCCYAISIILNLLLIFNVFKNSIANISILLSSIIFIILFFILINAELTYLILLIPICILNIISFLFLYNYL